MFVNCDLTTFETSLGNTVLVVYCGGDLGFLAYNNSRHLMLEAFQGEGSVVDLVLRILRKMSSNPGLEANFIVEELGADLESGTEAVRGYQHVDGWRLRGSGFFVRREYGSGVIQFLMVSNAYSGIPENLELPRPDYTHLVRVLEERGLPKPEVSIRGLRVCGGRLAYWVGVHVGVGRGSYEALIDSFSGELLSLERVLGFRTFKVVELRC